MSIPRCLYLKLRGANQYALAVYPVNSGEWQELKILNLKEFVINNLCTAKVLQHQLKFSLSENSNQSLLPDTKISSLYIDGQEPGATPTNPLIYEIVLGTLK